MKKRLLFGALLLISAVSFAQTINNAFFDKVNYRGAFGATDWTAGWSNFDPQNTVYPATETTLSGNITSKMTLGSPLFGATSYLSAPLLNSFFDKVDYIGAFGKTDWTEGWSNFNPQNTDYPATTVTVSGNITTNTTWTQSQVYLLNGFVRVQSGAVLTIEAGTVIRGDKVSTGTLIIEPGAQLIANGTATNPIVFTSNQGVGSRNYGDWGGLVLCGNATTNKVNPVVEGGIATIYGGSVPADNSGSLMYVRIEFPGVALTTTSNSEINGLTMCGVGSGTTIDNVQVSYSGDDSFEWFGGTVNAKHLIAFRGWDDDFDTDFGYTGNVQFGVSLRDPAAADQSSSNSFESDNDGTGTGATPLTAPVFSNISSFGPLATTTTSPIHAKFASAMHLRRNTSIKIYNSVFAGWPKGLLIDGAAAQTNADAENLVLKNVVMSGCTSNFVPTTPWLAADEQTWFNRAGFNNSIIADNASLALVDPFNLTSPEFTTRVKSYLLNGFVRVQTGAVLTVEPGTIIRGDKVSTGSLVIEPGAQLIANGTVTNPIVFTSNQGVGSRNYGDWGGLVLCGNATTNKVNPVVEGGIATIYGGSVPADNSGSLMYVRIEFPGVALTTTSNSEINGLTMCGVGSGTTIDNVQVSYSGDDSFEWFGGTVNAKHLIAFRGWDDDFDTDFGYTGNVQFGVSLRDPAAADQSSSNSFESDNDGTGTGATPLTAPVFSNISSFGPLATTTTSPIHAKFASAMHLRRNTSIKIYNSVFAGWPKGLLIDGAAAQTNADAENLVLKNVVMSGCTSNFVPTTPWLAADEQAWFNRAGFNNTIVANNASLALVNPFTLTAPNFLPTSTSILNVLSNWNTNGGTYTFNMPIVATALVNGSTLSATGSILMAYKNGSSVGSAFVNTANNQFALTVGSGVASDTELDLKLYDASSEMLYDLPTTFDFTNGGSFGTSGTPEVLQATASLSIPVNTGYTWISFNVLPEDKSITNVLNYNVQNGDELFGQGVSANYDGGWDGIDFIEKNKMYVLKTSSLSPGSITINNQRLVKNTPVTVKNGFTWIGYSLVNSASVNAAFSGMAINDGTQLFGQGVSDSYDGGWEGLTLNPGKGYKLKTTSAQSVFNYPSKLGSAARVSSVNAEIPSEWVTPTNMLNTANAYIKVYKSGALQATAGMTVAAFKGTECRGVKTLSGTRTYFALPIVSNLSTESGFTFKLYDPANGGVVYDMNETLDNFDCVNGYGTSTSTLTLSITSTSVDNTITSKKFNVYPNPVKNVFRLTLNSELSTNAQIDLYDLQGKHIQTIYSGVVNSNNTIEVNRNMNITNGMYLIKAIIGGEQHITKVVLQ
ncbi:MAG TPA: T9SS type A sorting domain-containing protein [Paludibacter sp.]|nr:T9SS type A sorting domain-containing protein [Paludibacter sp.]